MSESSTEKKEDLLEEKLSSEEWTIIDQKESRDDNASDGESGNQNFNLNNDTTLSEDACQTIETKPEIDHVEEGEEAAEKDIESDDISIISDESESEQVVVEEGRIQKIEWQDERQSNESRALIPNITLGESSSPHALISSTCLICSLIVVTVAIVIAGRVAHLQGGIVNYAANVDIAEKLKELATIEDKLKELSDVKQALDQIRISIPEMKKLKDQLLYQKYERNKFKYSLEDYKNFEQLNKQNIFNSHIKNDRLEMLEATYSNFCSIINKVNSSNSNDGNDLCRTPKVLSDMITFKKNLKRAFKDTRKNSMPEKRLFVDAGRKLDVISESLLSEFSTMFTRFSFKMQDRLNKFGYKLHQRLCLLNDFEKSDDPFLNILLDDDFVTNNCNATADQIANDYKSNASRSKNLRHREMKRNSVEKLKRDEKNDYKSNKAYRKFKSSNEDYTNTSEGESFNDIANIKSKGEMKYDTWKRNNHEKKRYYQMQNIFSKNDKLVESNENDYKQRKESKNKIGNSFEKIEIINQQYYQKMDGKNNERELKSDRKHDYKKIRDYDDHEYKHKSDRNANSKFSHSKEYHDSVEKFEGKKEHDYANQFESKENGEFGKKLEKKKNGRDDEIEDDNDDNKSSDDSKFIIKMDNGAEDNKKINQREERQKYKNKEYVLKPENFKESKYAKYDNHERRDRKNKYPTGEWQMQRGKAREKQRNSDWYFVRADSRQKARTSDEVEREHDGKEDDFRRRVVRKMGRTWDFLNKEIRNYL